ncbi:DoxX family protein [Sedimenticola sp.]|uniref:DoxX family protein n=1 Tax=Sedimenticola sp. TaxID=1940285 RepID=UPI003D0DDFF5
MKTVDENYSAIGALLLRLALGTMWISHALLKWFEFTIAGFGSWLESQGLPNLMAWPVFSLELIGGIMIVLGLYGRYVSVFLMPIMLVAAWTHSANGWVHTSAGGGWEYPVFLIFASIALTLIGDGRYALRSSRTLIPSRIK